MSLVQLMMKGRPWVSPPITDPIPGDPYKGGFYVGNIKVGTKTYRVITAPKAAEAAGLQWQTAQTSILGTTRNDGVANRAILAGSTYPASEYCRSYNGGGYTDWYLPSPDELELAYRNLKADPGANVIGARLANAGGGQNGENANSVPVGDAYTNTPLSPSQTTSVPFQVGGPQAFSAVSSTASRYWASQQSTDSGYLGYALMQEMYRGTQTVISKTNTTPITRPFRREEIVPEPVDPPEGPPGTPYQGGFYVGNIVVDGQEYYVVTAEQASTVGRAWKTTGTVDNFAFTFNDGLKNTNFINDAAHPAAQFARSYAGGGFTDWYLPSRDELELAYRNLKPSAQSNITGFRGTEVGGGNQGENANSNPTHPAYLSNNPTQTSIASFQANQPDAFAISPAYWSSTQATNPPSYDGYALAHSFYEGNQFAVDKTNPTGQVRPFRRIPVYVPPPPEIGDAYGGGYYYGDMNIGGQVYRMIVSPASSATTKLWKTTETTDVGATSTFDGWTNTNALNSATYPANNYCRTLTVGGKTDWYLPSRDELELLYRNFKPDAIANSIATRHDTAGGGQNGSNAYSVPGGVPYTTSNPGQTTFPLFKNAAGGTENLYTNAAATLWSSTTSSFAGNPFPAITQRMDTGLQGSSPKNTVLGVRAIRRELKT